MTLEQLLKQKRKEHGKTQADIAKLLKCSTPQYVSNNERGKSSYSPSHFKVLSKCLGVPVSQMIDLRCEDVRREMRKKLLGKV